MILCKTLPWRTLAAGLLIAGLPGASPPAHATFSTPRVANLATNAGAGQTITVTLTGTVAGDLIIIGMVWCSDSGCAVGPNTVTISSVGDGVTNYTQVANANDTGTAGAVHVDIWSGIGAGGTLSILITASSASAWYLEGNVSAWAGAIASPVDSVGNFADGSGPITVSTNGSTAVSGELIYSMAFGATGTTPGQTFIQGAGNKDEYQIAGAPGVYTNTFSSASGGWGTAIAAFKPTTAANLLRSLLGVGQ